MPALYHNSELTLCSVSVKSANKLSLQELTQLLILRFPENFPSKSQFPGGANARFAPLRTPMYTTTDPLVGRS